MKSSTKHIAREVAHNLTEYLTRSIPLVAKCLGFFCSTLYTDISRRRRHHYHIRSSEPGDRECSDRI